MKFELKYYSSLDGLRALAALGVIIAHFFTVKNIPEFPVVARFSALGGTGVSLFFVLSGFVITRILLHSRNGQNYFMSFYVRRILRIFPLYIVSLLCYYYIPYLLEIVDSYPPFSQQIYFWTYLQNFARTFNWPSAGPTHFWSLSVEEHFYFLWPAIIYFAYQREINTLFYFSFSLLLFPLVLRYIMLSKGLEIDVFTFTRLDQLTLGGILAILELKGYLNKKYFKQYLIVFASGVLLIILTSVLNEFGKDLFKHNAFGICYFGLIALVVVSSSRSVVTKVLCLPVMQYLGKISYGLYVWHSFASQLVNIYLRTDYVLINFVFLLLLTILISAVSFKFLETPFLKLKKYFIYSVSKPSISEVSKQNLTSGVLSND